MAGIILAIVGGMLAWRQWQDNKATTKKAAAAEYRANHGHATGDVPSTIKPKASTFASWHVPADNPRYIFIQKIGVRAMVKPTWLTKAGAIGTPTNIYDTAWYVHSAKPGQAGATLFDGHVGFWTKHGVFFDLKNLRAGDKIQIEKGDGEIINYSVVKTHTYPADAVDMKALLSPAVADKSGLNLITCTGDVINGNEYNERIVVFAEQV